MNLKPEISVIVANYNHSNYIEYAINSILKQTFQNFEIIVVDDKSTDNSKKIINEICKKDKRIKAIFLNENRGKWHALNTAISAANGNIITLNDADDASAPQRLEYQLEVLTRQKSIHNLCGFKHCYSQEEVECSSNMLYPNIYDIIEHQTLTKLVYKGFKTPGINHYFVGMDYEIHGASSMFYKQIWDCGLKFNPNGLGLMLKPGEDSDHNLRITLLLQKTSVLKLPLYSYRRNSSTNPSWKNPL